MRLDLIERLESAPEGSREWDARIAWAINWNNVQSVSSLDAEKIIESVKNADCYIDVDSPPSYTVSLDAARGLSNWVLIYASDIGADGLALVRLGNPAVSPSPEVSGIHSSLEIAWCIAGLKAQEAAR